MGDNQFIDMLYAHEINFIIKGDILRTELHSSTSRHPLLLPSILCQCKILDIALTKLLFKIILPDLLRCSLLLLMFLERIVLVGSIKKNILFNT